MHLRSLEAKEEHLTKKNKRKLHSTDKNWNLSSKFGFIATVVPRHHKNNA